LYAAPSRDRPRGIARLSGAAPASAATPDPYSLVTPDQFAAAGASGTSTESTHVVFGAECFILPDGSIAGAVK
jgi:hypothetical protein